MMEAAMASVSKPTCQTVSAESEAIRQGVELCTMRWVLAVSSGLAVIAMIVAAALA
jgi:hypothetical protein